MPQVGTNGNDPETYFNNMDPVIYGLDGDDFIRWTVIPTVTGTAVVNAYIDGGRGNDTLFGGIGDDIIYGGDGNDLVRGEGGIDVVYGGDGNDVVHIRSGGGGRGEGGTRLAQPSTVFGGRGDDLIYSVGRNRLFGDDGNDTRIFLLIERTLVASAGFPHPAAAIRLYLEE